MREWWLRTLLVLSAPRAVFVALRGDDPDEVAVRAEPVLAIVLLAGVAFVLSTHLTGRLLDEPDGPQGIVIAVWVFLAGFLYGGLAYWVVGGVLFWILRALGSEGTYLRARHLLAFAAVPVALALAVWPVKLALYGGDLFHRGGSDRGAGADVFDVIWLAACLWAAALLAIGVRAVHGWTWWRAAVATAVPLAVGAGLALL
jgi:hypothetical protein